ncbi:MULTISPECIES: hypothetical protein [unclassified Rhizobium]|nr:MULTISPECIES: hypothetical protein [unclassified Rhizobium]QYA15420.1 hypothetical protein J5284_20675 [Rhizobium sp. AB2/73]
MILTFKSIEQAAAGKSTAFSPIVASIAERAEYRFFLRSPFLAGEHALFSGGIMPIIAEANRELLCF